MHSLRSRLRQAAHAARISEPAAAHVPESSSKSSAGLLRSSAVLGDGGCSAKRHRSQHHICCSAARLRRVYVSEGGAADGPDATCLVCAQATALLTTAPQLRVFEAHLKGDVHEAAALVQAAARLGALRVRFGVQLAPDSTDRTYDMAANGIARAAREPGQAPQPRAPAFAGAVRASGDTTSLEFFGTLHGQESAPTLLAALQAHPRVRVVELQLPADAFDETETADDGDAHPLADALAALVAANSPTLQQLHVRTARALCSVDLAPLVEALLLNTHLTTLRCGPAGDVSEDFARRVLLPAVRGNASLRVLRICEEQESPALREAEALVQQRSGGA
jgi:hypothetical protein